MLKRLNTMLVLSLLVVLLAACGPSTGAGTHAASQSSDKVKVDNGVITHTADAKIASMSIHITNNLLALGIQPAGSVIGGDVKDFLPHVQTVCKAQRSLGQ